MKPGIPPSSESARSCKGVYHVLEPKNHDEARGRPHNFQSGILWGKTPKKRQSQLERRMFEGSSILGGQPSHPSVRTPPKPREKLFTHTHTQGFSPILFEEPQKSKEHTPLASRRMVSTSLIQRLSTWEAPEAPVGITGTSAAPMPFFASRKEDIAFDPTRKEAKKGNATLKIHFGFLAGIWINPSPPAICSLFAGFYRSDPIFCALECRRKAELKDPCQ